MSDFDDATAEFLRALGSVASFETNGQVFFDVETILTINHGIMAAFQHPGADFEVPDEFLRGAMLTMELYRQVHAGILMRHAAHLVPDAIPDGMDDVVN